MIDESSIDFSDGAPASRQPTSVIARLDNPFPEMTLGAMVAVESNRAIAEVQTARLMARQFPRDARKSVDRILTACSQPELAAMATYMYPRGNEVVTGPTIRLAEAVARDWGNMVASVVEMDREKDFSWVRAYATDYETGFTDEKVFQVRHWRDTKGGGYKLKDERDIYEMVANFGARRKRSCIQAVVPRSVFDLAVNQCDVALSATASTDKEAVERMLKLFAKFGLTQDHIERKIGCHLDAIAPGQMVMLRKVYNALADGVAKPSTYFDVPEENGTDEPMTMDSMVKKSEGDAPSVTLETIRAKVAEAQTLDALNDIESLIGALAEKEARVQAYTLVNLKRDSFPT